MAHYRLKKYRPNLRAKQDGYGNCSTYRFSFRKAFRKWWVTLKKDVIAEFNNMFPFDPRG
jgi:hypothetical protein